MSNIAREMISTTEIAYALKLLSLKKNVIA